MALAGGYISSHRCLCIYEHVITHTSVSKLICICLPWLCGLLWHQCDPCSPCLTSCRKGPGGKICRRQIHGNTFHRTPSDPNKGLESSLEARQHHQHILWAVRVLIRTACSWGFIHDVFGNKKWVSVYFGPRQYFYTIYIAFVFKKSLYGWRKCF